MHYFQNANRFAWSFLFLFFCVNQSVRSIYVCHSNGAEHELTAIAHSSTGEKAKHLKGDLNQSTNQPRLGLLPQILDYSSLIVV